jgi:hypothetical protein
MVRARTDLPYEDPENGFMNPPTILAIDTDRYHGDVIITFNDDRAAVFSAAFLYASLSSAQEIFLTDADIDDEHINVQ